MAYKDSGSVSKGSDEEYELELKLQTETSSRSKAGKYDDSYKLTPEHVLRKLREDRANLIDIINILETTLSTITDIDYLNEEFKKQFPTFKEDVELHKRRLEEKLPIVVVGETGAGKSSFLNVILDAYILPVDNLHCTSMIVKIDKGELGVETNGTRIPSHASNQEKAEDFVQETLLTEFKSGNESGSTEAIVHWSFPSPLLLEDVVIVDTPGFGPKETLNNMLMSYLTESVGFLYIVNSENSGGIQEDRLQRVITDQLKYSKEHNVNIMDPNRAFFFFNKWDQIKPPAGGKRPGKKTRQGGPAESELAATRFKIWQNNISTLSDIWSDFSSDQAMKFSVTKANSDDNPCDDVDDDQVEIARSKIAGVLDNSLKYGLNPTKGWLCEVSCFLAYTFRIYKHATGTTADDQMKERKQRFQSKKEDVQKQANATCEEIANRIDDDATKLGNMVFQHLSTEAVKARIHKWSSDQLHGSIYFSSKSTLQTETANAVSFKIAAIIRRDLGEKIKHVTSQLLKFLERKRKEIRLSLRHLSETLSKDIEGSNNQPDEIELQIQIEKFDIQYDTIRIDFQLNSLLSDWSENRFVRFFEIGLFRKKTTEKLLKTASECAIENVDDMFFQNEFKNMLEAQNNKTILSIKSNVAQTMKSLEQKCSNILLLQEREHQTMLERISENYCHWSQFFQKCVNIY